MQSENIRNFSVIAHIDHGKSTLADRMLETTETVEKRKMQAQVLDKMELERERGITIKMAPVRMNYSDGGEEYVLNMIDTPGHVDFAYEVSRSLKAVDGALLLVDSTQGVQAQTLTTLDAAREMGLVIIPVITKIDSPLARPGDVKKELADLLGVAEETVLAVSGKTGEGVDALLREIVARIPAPQQEAMDTPFKGLVFDFSYSEHRGVVLYTRIFSGSIKKGDMAMLAVGKEKFTVLEVGVFTPQETPADSISGGETGYIVTGIKEPAKAVVGDTVTLVKKPAEALAGYLNPQPTVWASVYPESQDDFGPLKQALERLQLSDASLQFEEESSAVLGRGFRCGFLGMLHLEIAMERLRREFGLELIVTFPSIVYEVKKKGGAKLEKIYSPAQFPEHGLVEQVLEPWAALRLITPAKYLGDILQTLYAHEAVVGETEAFGFVPPKHDSAKAGDGRMNIEAKLPLRELMRGLFDEVKSVSSGYASFSYEQIGQKPAKVTRLDVLVADEVVPAFSQVVPEHRAYDEAKRAVERLHEVLPKQLFTVKIQGKALGRILASKTLSALKKDVTGHLYGGDITRKRKLWEKQKKGKKKMGARGKVHIPHEVFLKMISNK